jgi:pimeloyl-ACP methyl ester carboxylesterase
MTQFQDEPVARHDIHALGGDDLLANITALDAVDPALTRNLLAGFAESSRSRALGFGEYTLVTSILIGRADEHRRLGTITDVPALIIAGEEDSQFPVHKVRKMADAIAGSTFCVLPRTGHLAARENPEGVNAEVDAFLASLPATV